MSKRDDVFDDVELKRELGIERDQNSYAYAILGGSKTELKKKVHNAIIKYGYTPLGGIQADRGANDSLYFYQAVVRQ